MEKNKVLIIRFSSFGDIVQCSAVVDLIATSGNDYEIHWVTRSEFTGLVSLNKNIAKVYGFNRSEGFLGLVKLGKTLLSNNYLFVYDAHNNLRSNFLNLFFRICNSKSVWITRSKDRLKRILLFLLRINLFPKPFKGIDSFLDPLLKSNYKISLKESHSLVSYKFTEEIENKVLKIINNKKNIITIVPSAAWKMKRWPIKYWQDLILLATEFHFFILGGKDDTFCEDIRKIAPDRVSNLAGELSLIESTCFVKFSRLVISGDTGLLHVADVLGIKGISLMGPTAFGFTKSKLIKTLEVPMDCRPCSKDGRGKCSMPVYQQCLIDIKPEEVNSNINSIYNSN